VHDDVHYIDCYVVWWRQGGWSGGVVGLMGLEGFELRNKSPPTWLRASASDK
jgi:hypothetical protein